MQIRISKETNVKIKNENTFSLASNVNIDESMSFLM